MPGSSTATPSSSRMARAVRSASGLPELTRQSQSRCDQAAHPCIEFSKGRCNQRLVACVSFTGNEEN